MEPDCAASHKSGVAKSVAETVAPMGAPLSPSRSGGEVEGENKWG